MKEKDLLPTAKVSDSLQIMVYESIPQPKVPNKLFLMTELSMKTLWCTMSALFIFSTIKKGQRLEDDGTQ